MESDQIIEEEIKTSSGLSERHKKLSNSANYIHEEFEDEPITFQSISLNADQMKKQKDADLVTEIEIVDDKPNVIKQTIDDELNSVKTTTI